VAGINLSDTEDPQIQDLLRKYGERSGILSENSEDSLTFSAFHALSKLADRGWVLDFFRAAFGPKTVAAYAPHVHEVAINFWKPHHSPQVYLEYLANRLRKEGESAFGHLTGSSLAKAKERLARVRAGDIQWAEMPTETDVVLTIGKRLIVFCEVKLYSDISMATMNGSDNRNQLLRNLELVHAAKEQLGFEDARFVLLTLDRAPVKTYSKLLRRYRGPDLRKLRVWDEVTPGWLKLKKDLPHRTESDEWYQRLNTSLGWIIWPEMLKLLIEAYCRELKQTREVSRGL
jgi:hypothetical protein